MIAALASIYVAGAAWLAYLMATAPEGYEDATGFHYGRPDE